MPAKPGTGAITSTAIHSMAHPRTTSCATARPPRQHRHRHRHQAPAPAAAPVGSVVSSSQRGLPSPCRPCRPCRTRRTGRPRSQLPSRHPRPRPGPPRCGTAGKKGVSRRRGRKQRAAAVGEERSGGSAMQRAAAAGSDLPGPPTSLPAADHSQRLIRGLRRFPASWGSARKGGVLATEPAGTQGTTAASHCPWTLGARVDVRLSG